MSQKEKNAVVQWICSGHTLTDIEAAIASKMPQANKAEIIRAALEQIETSGQINETMVRGYAFESYKMLQAKMMEIGDYQGALKAVKEIVALTKNSKNEKTISIKSF